MADFLADSLQTHYKEEQRRNWLQLSKKYSLPKFYMKETNWTLYLHYKESYKSHGIYIVVAQLNLKLYLLSTLK